MFAFGVSRVDTGAEGIHLAWNAPEELCLSSPGFDIQRRPVIYEKDWVCVGVDPTTLAQMRSQQEYPTTLGTMLYRTAGPLLPIDPAGTTGSWPPGQTAVEAFLLELSAPTFEFLLNITTTPSKSQANTVFVVGMAGGRAVTATFGAGDGSSILLLGPEMDSLLLYIDGPYQFTICVKPVPDPSDADWVNVPYLSTGLTLPIEQADPSLTTEAQELTAAQSRLVTGETFSQTDFENMAPPLRLALSEPSLGRPEERIVLLRSNVGEPFEELLFSQQLALLQIHPGLRRILGFGYFDPQSSGLVAGQTYEYRITGHFNGPDLADTIFDVQAIPSQTVLPATFRIGALALTFAQPVSVVLDPAPDAMTTAGVSRRGILITGGTALVGWTGPSLEGWSVILDLPVPASTVVLETNATQTFQYAGGDPWLFTTTAVSAPSGSRVELTFASPVTQIRLQGQGILFAIRLPGTPASGTVVGDTGPIPYAAQPLPLAPLSLNVSNLQDPSAVLTTRSLPGFKLTWLPAPATGVTVWPDDTTGAPPLDAIAFQIEHQDATAGSGTWEPIEPGDNLSLGTRDAVDPPIGLGFGSDLGELFPLRWQRSSTAGNTMHLSDIFQVNDASGTFVRPLPAFGTMHQYRIRAMDTVGRVSADWTVSNIVRLEKHVPPPLPAGPQPEPVLVTQPDGSTRWSGVPGVKARALVAGDPALAPGDLAILGSHQNAILLDWGWRDSERQLDPLASEFRVYSLQMPPDQISGTITLVTPATNGWYLSFRTDSWLVSGECVGQWITTGGYPFRIAGHTTGSDVVISVETALVNPTVAPFAGSAQFGRPLQTSHQRPPAWDSRVAVVPLTSAASYEYIFYDLLQLTAAQPLDTVWVGVSSADAESYVEDELPATATNGGRPGNESSIVTCVVSGRDHTRPVFSIPPPLGNVPEIVGEEPSGRQILVFMDLIALLPNALAAGTPIAVDRCPADSIFAITSLNSAKQVVLGLKDGTQQIVAFANPADEAAVIGYLQSANPERMLTQYLLFLAANHSRPEEIFLRLSDEIDSFGVVQDRVAPKPARYFYRVRRADALGRVSQGGAIVPAVVRVPSIVPPIAPERVALTAEASLTRITLRVPSDPELDHLLVFPTTLPFTSPISDLSGAELLRTPNRPDLYPENGIRLRVPGSSGLIAPVAKALTDADVTTDADGNRTAMVTVPGVAGTWSVLWAYSLSQDGIPSRAAGPFTVGVPPA